MKECLFLLARIPRVLVLNLLSKKCLFLLNLTVGSLILLIVISRFHDTNIFAIRFKKFPRSDLDNNNNNPLDASSSITRNLPNTNTKLKVPWRFQIEEDGFVFPISHPHEKFVTYEPVNGSWSEQILHFENALVVAHLLKRTLLAPPLLPWRLREESGAESGYQGDEEVPLFDVLDSEVLGKKVKVMDLKDVPVERFKAMNKRYICLDSRLGFWLDYIPSVENIQTWRMLRQQYFLQIDINSIKNDRKCPETIFGRWTYPKTTKPQYRGILTELTKVKDDVIYLYKDTLARTFLRIFDKQRAIELQELLLLYVRFTPAINSRLKILISLLGPAYTAVVLEPTNNTETHDQIISSLKDDLQIVDSRNVTTTIFASGNVSKKSFLRQFSTVNRRVVFGTDFVRDNIAVLDGAVHPDKSHLFEQLLCAYADLLVTENMMTSNISQQLPMTSNTHFIRHLRINELFTSEGIAIENINVRWAKHTTKTNSAKFQKQKQERTRLLRILQNEDGGTLQNASVALESGDGVTRGNFTGSIRDKLKHVSHIVLKKNDPGYRSPGQSGHTTNNREREITGGGGGGGGGSSGGGGGGGGSGAGGKSKKDQLAHMVCLFCNYIRHITGHHGCPSMKHVC